MANLRPFQIVLLGTFAALALGSLILLGAYQASVSEDSQRYGDYVEIWGTFDRRPMDSLFETIRNDIKSFQVVKYVEFSEDEFEKELVNAIAEGRGPDLVILSSKDMVKYRPKMIALPYDIVSPRTFKDTYVDGAEIFTFPEGTYTTPFAVDPLMLYWNRDLFAGSGLAQAPKTWEEVVNTVVPNITTVNNQRDIIQSAIAFGEYRNLVNPKAILMALAMQSGSRMVYLEEGRYQIELDQHIDTESKKRPLQLALEFFINFSNSNSQLYTWNRAQPLDKNAFISGELAMYFGLASEYPDISSKNPNLNFDVAPVPQGSTATIKRTYADFYGFAIPQSSLNPDGAYQAALTLAGTDYVSMLAESYGMVSSRRDVIAAGSLDPSIQATMNSALVARGWWDPEPDTTSGVLLEMVENVVSNRERVNRAVADAVGLIAREF